MRRIVLLFVVLVVQLVAQAQDGQNPFDLSSSTPGQEESTSIETSKEIEAVPERNPFDLGGEEAVNHSETTDEIEKSGNPFDLGHTEVEAPPVASAPLDLPKDSPLETGNIVQEELVSSDGWILSVTFFVLAIAAFVFIFFRSLYVKVYKAILNDNQLSLLYRERKGGAIGSFFIAYGLFFLSAGWFILLTLRHYNLMPDGEVLSQYTLITASLVGLFILKHLVLALLGYVFPISKEVHLYSFSIMIFSIVLGILMPFADLMLAYSTNTGKPFIIYLMGFIILVVYLLRSLRSIFIANRFVFNFSFHFLLYLCAVEIAPVLILYKLLYDIGA